MSAQGGVCPGGVYQHAMGQTPPPVDTSFAGGNIPFHCTICLFILENLKRLILGVRPQSSVFHFHVVFVKNYAK